MTVADQIKILDGKTKQNEAQYDLDGKEAKISAFSSNDFDKYEYLVQIWILSQALLSKQDLIILHWLKFSIKD